MNFYDITGRKISKKEASPTVLALFRNGEPLNVYINYHDIKTSIIKEFRADKVYLYTNHAGNDTCTASHMHSTTTRQNVRQINKELQEEQCQNQK